MSLMFSFRNKDVKKIESLIVGCPGGEIKLEECRKNLIEVVKGMNTAQIKSELFTMAFKILNKEGAKQHTILLTSTLIAHILNVDKSLLLNSQTPRLLQLTASKMNSAYSKEPKQLAWFINSICELLAYNNALNAFKSSAIFKGECFLYDSIYHLIESIGIASVRLPLQYVLNDEYILHLLIGGNIGSINAQLISKLVGAYFKYSLYLDSIVGKSYIIIPEEHSSVKEMRAIIQIINATASSNTDLYARFNKSFLQENIFANIKDEATSNSNLKCLALIIQMLEPESIIDFISTEILTSKPIHCKFLTCMLKSDSSKSIILSVIHQLIAKRSYAFIKYALIDSIKKTANYTPTTTQDILCNFKDRFNQFILSIPNSYFSIHNYKCLHRITANFMLFERRKEAPVMRIKKNNNSLFSTIIPGTKVFENSIGLSGGISSSLIALFETFDTNSYDENLIITGCLLDLLSIPILECNPETLFINLALFNFEEQNTRCFIHHLYILSQKMHEWKKTYKEYYIASQEIKRKTESFGIGVLDYEQKNNKTLLNAILLDDFILEILCILRNRIIYEQIYQNAITSFEI